MDYFRRMALHNKDYLRSSILFFFCGSAIAVSTLLWGPNNFELKHGLTCFVMSLLSSLAVPAVWFFRRRHSLSFQIAIRSIFLGWCSGTSICLMKYSQYTCFGIYALFISVFHYSEFLTISVTRPEEPLVKSFMLNHSPEYIIATVFCTTEYFLEFYVLSFTRFNDLKSFGWISAAGVIMCLIGEVVRKISMFTTGENFTHVVRVTKVQGHELITSGIYSLCRHPAYGGWYLWVIGSQIVLLNPLSFCLYLRIVNKFFKQRIYSEEAHLILFFGEKYLDYKKKVSFSGVPFAYGYEGL